MDSFSRAYYELTYTVAFLEKRGEAFQDFFATIMEKRYPADFQRTRPWGRSGDRKNDGYLRSKRPGFLVHDSHLFDGVDERQVANALAVGARVADELGFQYIVTMNSDAVPSEFPSGFDVRSHVIEPRLTDSTEGGGLFGVAFG